MIDSNIIDVLKISVNRPTLSDWLRTKTKSWLIVSNACSSLVNRNLVVRLYHVTPAACRCVLSCSHVTIRVRSVTQPARIAGDFGGRFRIFSHCNLLEHRRNIEGLCALWTEPNVFQTTRKTGGQCAPAVVEMASKSRRPLQDCGLQFYDLGPDTCGRLIVS